MQGARRSHATFRQKAADSHAGIAARMLQRLSGAGRSHGRTQKQLHISNADASGLAVLRTLGILTMFRHFHALPAAPAAWQAADAATLKIKQTYSRANPM